MPGLRLYVLELLYDGEHFGVPANDDDWHQACAHSPIAEFTRVIDHVEPHVVLRLRVAVMQRRIGDQTYDLLLTIVRAAPGLWDRFREYAHEPRQQRPPNGPRLAPTTREGGNHV